MDAFKVHRDLIEDHHRFTGGFVGANFGSGSMFMRFGAPRDQVEHALNTFPIVKRKDEAEFGEYRTKRLIMESYDRMQECINSGTDFVSMLDPAPGFGPRHPERTIDA